MPEESNTSILIVDDIPENIAVLLDYLTERGFRVLVAEDGESAIEQLQFAKPDLILLDVMMPGIDGFDTCRLVKQNVETKDIPIIFMTALTDVNDKVKAFDAGAVDYITKPIQHEEVLARVNTHLSLRRLQKELRQMNIVLEEKVEERTSELTLSNKKLKAALEELQLLKNKLQQENIYLKEEIDFSHNFNEIITNSRGMKLLLTQIEQVAGTDSTVLILGETGTGKELIARAVHSTGKRSSHPLVKVNCAALPANLIESELFGHEKGAFTGALAKKIGRFELADGGTIFLDEIGDLPLELQSKLLRILQEGEYERLGNPHTFEVDVRVIAATNRNLEESIDNGTFREDLYYRLNVFPLQLPPLRERENDIPLLVKFFTEKYCRKIGKDITQIPQSTIDLFESYHWPGNIRELENVIERAVIISNTNILEVNEMLLPRRLTHENTPKPGTLKEAERDFIQAELEKSNWIIDGKRGAARKLGLAPSTLRDRMKKLGISRPE